MITFPRFPRKITGLDPAGPCFSHVDDDLRLKNTDADFVDVIHTDGGVYGLTDAVGDVDYFPNDGEQQPDCLFQTCSHSRAWLYFTESVVDRKAFPAVKCDSWEAFKNGSCEDKISYMGYPSQPGTKGLYYLQTAGETPFGIGMNGTVYRNTNGIVKNITQYLFPSSAIAPGPDVSLRGLYTIVFVFYTMYIVS
ncbi:hypothetical protein O0L34_g17747 [Tuta absoluta]|nr:hypothetical protein O0L34_g17747 [Tuta absoluta]